MTLCKECGRYEAEEGKKRCVWCSARLRRRSNGRVTRQKAAVIELLGSKCAHCGYNEDIPDAYDFHHRDPKEKEDALSRLLGRASWKKVIAEAQKCDLLCANCHRKLHYLERKTREEFEFNALPDKSDKAWTKKENQTITLSIGLTLVELQAQLSHRSPKAVRSQIYRLGLGTKRGVVIRKT